MQPEHDGGGNWNYEVVKKLIPCAFFADFERPSECRWCQMLHHVRIQGNSRTLCGHLCLPEDDWMHMMDWHPEDVSAIDRCQVCYERV